MNLVSVYCPGGVPDPNLLLPYINYEELNKQLLAGCLVAR